MKFTTTPIHHFQRCHSRWFRESLRFASGNGQRIKKANIDISTPTAQIAINGTDFTTTIDELGRTLVILLPDADGVTPSGEIVVSNEGGEVVLNQAFQATMVSTIETPPTRSVVINNLTTSMIDNMFIVAPSGGQRGCRRTGKR